MTQGITSWSSCESNLALRAGVFVFLSCAPVLSTPSPCLQFLQSKDACLCFLELVYATMRNLEMLECAIAGCVIVPLSSMVLIAWRQYSLKPTQIPYSRERTATCYGVYYRYCIVIRSTSSRYGGSIASHLLKRRQLGQTGSYWFWLQLKNLQPK